MNKQRQMAEFERQRLEALQLMEQKLRNDHLEQQRRKVGLATKINIARLIIITYF